MTKESERRVHTRIDFEHSGEALIEQRLNIEIINLSAGGMGLKTNLPIEPGSICNLVLFQGNVSIQSQVVSCTRIPRRKMRFQVGCQFTKVSAQLLEEVLEMEKRFKGREIRVTSEPMGEDHGTVVVKFPPEISLEEWNATAKLVNQGLDEGMRIFIFNFADVGNAEAAFLDRLVGIEEEIRFEEGRLILSNCSSKLLSSLTVAQMASSIPIFETPEKALHSIKSGRIDIREEG